MRRCSIRRVSVFLAVAITTASSPYRAWAGDSILNPGVPSAAAVRVDEPRDVVSVSQLSDLDASLESAVMRAARRAGATALTTRGAMAAMLGVYRGGTAVQLPPEGFVIPMGFSAIPQDAMAIVFGRNVAVAVAGGGVALSATSARLRGARVGDVIALQTAAGGSFDVPIALIADDASLGGAEIVASIAVADAIGVTKSTRVLVWGFRSREAIVHELAVERLGPPGVRIVRSWDPSNPDSAIGLPRTKELLGEFAYRPAGGDQLTLTPGWQQANIRERTEFAGVAVRAACHVKVHPAIQGALNEVAAAGLAGLVDTADTNRYGGCFNPRWNRVTGNLGFVSRHAWGQALDINVSQNPLGAVPKLDCRIVKIFRKWGFAWGGNYTSRDGMHFEWVGEPRDQLVYPSMFCPNFISADAKAPKISQSLPVSATARAAMFAGDGLMPDASE